MGEDILLGAVIVIALTFDFTNGFHDTANAMATSIATQALRPRVAVALSAVLNVVGAFLSLEVAKTIAGGIVDQNIITLNIVFAGLAGAIVWNIATWLFGLPSSSSHALIGGVVGAALFGAGTGAIEVSGIISKVVIPALLAPVIAGGVAALGTIIVYAVTHHADERIRTRSFRIGQVASASLVSLAHGTNDAQKTMGVIMLALIAHGSVSGDADVPLWVIVSCALAIGLGTYSGGWRVIRFLGHRLVKIHPPQGFAAETSTSLVLLVSSHLGLPLSTTQVSSGSIIGSGVGRRTARIDWAVARQMVWAWLLTLPAAGAVGGLVWLLTEVIGGPAGVLFAGVVVAAVCGWMVLLSRRNPVHADNVNHVDDETAEAVETAEAGETVETAEAVEARVAVEAPEAAKAGAKDAEEAKDGKADSLGGSGTRQDVPLTVLTPESVLDPASACVPDLPPGLGQAITPEAFTANAITSDALTSGALTSGIVPDLVPDLLSDQDTDGRPNETPVGA